jgi:hypothetical protein
MAHHVPWQGRIEWFATTLGALLGWNVLVIVFVVFFLRCRLCH